MLAARVFCCFDLPLPGLFVDDLLVVRLTVLFLAVLALADDGLRLVEAAFFLGLPFLGAARLLFFSGINSERKKSRSLGFAKTSNANMQKTIKKAIIFPQ